MAKTISKATEKKLLEIAKKNSVAVENRGDLKSRHSDSEDFIEVSVWGIEEMLKAAYELGRAAVAAENKPKPDEKQGIKITQVDGNWKKGTIDGIKFQAKVYEKPSEEYGIDGGHVSKLWIDGMANYDRGWDVRPKTAEAKAKVKALLEYFAQPENCK